MRIKEFSEDIEHMQTNTAGGNFLPNVHEELSDLSKQLVNCFHIWVSYFTLSQTKSYQLFRQCVLSRAKLIGNDLSKHEQCLVDLHRLTHCLQTEQQKRLDRLLQYYLDRLTEGESYSTVLPFVNSDKADTIFVACYAMYYSTSQLAKTVLTLGRTIHTLFELETTHLYRPF